MGPHGFLCDAPIGDMWKMVQILIDWLTKIVRLVPTNDVIDKSICRSVNGK
jgi:hypothetical protein